jgi:acetolactate synthase small subunit
MSVFSHLLGPDVIGGVDRAKDSLHSVNDELGVDRHSNNSFMREAIACVKANLSSSRSDSEY